MPPLAPSSILLILILQTSSPASADRRFGCLFQRDLCTPYEICINDGMFGRCHSDSPKVVYSYDVTLPVVQHFRLLLDKMANRGLTWEDDTTQQVLAKELSKVRRFPHRLPLSSTSYKTADSSRTKAEVMDPVEQRLKPAEAELNRNLETYLQRLGLRPRITEGLNAAAKSGRVQSDLYGSKSDPTSQKMSSSLKAMQSLSAEELQVLLSALRQLEPSTRLRPVYSYGIESSEPKTLKFRPVNLDKNKGSSAKDPLTLVDEKFIQNVLKNIGKQHLDVDNLTPHDVDQLSNLIVDALHVVDHDQAGDRGRAQLGPRDLEGELSDGKQEKDDEKNDEKKLMEGAPTVRITPTDVPQEVHQQTDNKNMEDKPESPNVFSKLLAYLDQSPFTDPPLPPPGPQRRAGLENVQSRTREGGEALQKKDTTQSVEEVSEVEGWVKEVAPPPAALKYEEAHKKMLNVPELQLDVKADRNKVDDVFGYVITDTDGLQTDEGLHMMEILARMARIQMTDFAELSVVGPAVTFKVSPNRHNVSTADVVHVAVEQKASLEKEAKLSILEAGVADGNHINQIPTKYSQAESTKFLILTVVSILCIVGVLLASTTVYCLRHRSHHKLKEKLTNLGADTSSDATATYQDLCRQRMAVKPPVERPEPVSSRINSVSSQFSDGGAAVSPSARSSLSSWSEEPAQPNMDISTGHMILSYMEDHLKNKNRLEKEWEALCAYQAEPNASTVGLKDGNAKKNRSAAVVAYDHSRITLRLENSQGNSDYINASPIMDHDPRNPAYIATQGPLPSTVADFWQMVWENGCVVIVMLTPLVESGVKQCYHYWPDEGSNLYHIYEVNLVSEHIWCDDFLVRSFYLKNMQTNETRTVTQFHFLTWLNQNIPETSRTLLDFRRKVNKCYRGRSCPIIVHCSDGAGRSGTYILIDMVLNKMAKGAKEIDIAATLEHLRDQRPGMVQTKDQFEFALTTVAEEVNAILKALPQ
uniref:receptor-type tyrosine-protein phosphatase N2-like n=1 Tax=Doryrhamphus excisus TaxID=161450 RepID=UPI0025AE2DD9|nr:receptor-type tyrosine-protein phosphatase N2-like [Doryrhamphus excisus]